MKPSLGTLARSSINNERSVRLSILISAEDYGGTNAAIFRYSIHELELNGIGVYEYSDKSAYCKPVGRFVGTWTCEWRP